MVASYKKLLEDKSMVKTNAMRLLEVRGCQMVVNREQILEYLEAELADLVV